MDTQNKSKKNIKIKNMTYTIETASDYDLMNLLLTIDKIIGKNFIDVALVNEKLQELEQQKRNKQIAAKLTEILSIGFSREEIENVLNSESF